MAHDHSVKTDGRVIHWAGFYDLLLKVVTLGREGTFRGRIIEVAGLAAGERVLDVGCGTGTLALAAARAVGSEGSVRGIDPAAEMIARARAKAAKAGADVTFEVGAIEALELPDRSVDVVLSSLMFHHLPVHLQAPGLSEIRRVLVPDGRLVVIDFGKPDALVEMAKTAGFGSFETARLKPKALFSLVAGAGNGGAS